MAAESSYFNTLVKEYSEPLYWHIRRMVVNHDDASDVLQETLIRAYRKLWLLRDKKAVKPWLYRIATNEANRFLSKKYRTESLPDSLADKLMESEYVDYTQQAEIKLQQALLKLSPLQREVFCLKYYDEMDYETIATITGSTEGSVKASYSYAKDKVKQYLEIKS